MTQGPRKTDDVARITISILRGGESWTIAANRISAKAWAVRVSGLVGPVMAVTRVDWPS